MTAATLKSKLSGLVDQVPVKGHLSRVQEKRWVRGRVLRAMPGYRFNVAGIRYNGCVLLKRFK